MPWLSFESFLVQALHIDNLFFVSIVFFLAEALIMADVFVQHVFITSVCNEHVLALSIHISSLVQVFHIGDLFFVFVVFLPAEALVMFQ